MVTGLPPAPAQISTVPAAFGFRVRSEQPLRFLRSGGGVEPLEVVMAPEPRRRPDTVPLVDWMLAGADPAVRGTLYQVDRGFDFWAIPAGDDAVVREQRLWGTPAALCFMHRGDVPLHAAAVEVGGAGVLLAAPRRHGKTTLALAFHRLGYRVLCEDLACCRLGGPPALLPGPALLRIRPDVYDGHPPAGTHIALARDDRVYVALDDDRKGGSAPVPIKAIVFLRESADDLRLERFPTDEARARSFHQLTRLANALPAWNLYRPVRLASLDATVARIVEELDRDQG